LVTYLLDTNVVSEIRKSKPDQNVIRWFDAAPSHSLHLSVLVLGELRQGIERLRRRDPQQAEALDRWLSGMIRGYADRIAPVTEDVAERWGRLNVAKPLPVVDSLMAATALVHDWTLVTRNVKDVQSTGVKLLNPFDEQD
jgi:predicted nucleic acid-binding protein